MPKLRGNFYEPSYVYLKNFPIRLIDFDNPTHKAKHNKIVERVEIMLTLNQKLASSIDSHSRTVLKRQIEATDRQIDQLVYQLYDLTTGEIEIVETRSQS